MTMSLKFHQDSAAHHQLQLDYHKAQAVKILANQITAVDIFPGKSFHHPVYKRLITVLAVGWNTGRYGIGGLDDNPFLPYRNMHDVTAAELAEYLNHRGFIK